MKIPRPIFYILSLTWGLPLTLIGLFAALYHILKGRRPKKFGLVRYFEYGHGWGGCSLGLFILVNSSPSEHILEHEQGHAIQNIIFGPFMLVLVALPSFIRYHYRDHKRKKSPRAVMKPYDAIWFEGQATRWGKALCESEKLNLLNKQ